MSDFYFNGKRWPATPFENIAVHEAGHAVIATVLGLRVKSVTIVANEKRGAGFCGMDQGKQVRLYRGNSEDHAEIIFAYAGRLAEFEILGNDHAGTGHHGDYDDITNLAWHCGSSPARLARLERFSRILVRRHRGLIHEVAARLLRQGTVSGAWLRQFIADVVSLG